MQQKRLRKSLFWNLAAKRMLQSAGTIHYTAQAEFDLVKRSLGLTNGIVVPLGIETNARSTNGSRAATENQYVLVLSRLHPKKGLDVLIKAFVALHKNERFSEWRLVIAGDGDSGYVNSLKQIVTENAAGAFVSFVGWVSGNEKREVLRNASLLILPSRQENFGLCVLEALAEGVPVVVSRDVNLAKDIADAGAGWISDVDAVALENILAEVLADKELRLSRGLAGKEFSQNFSWDRIAAKLETMYLSIMNEMAAYR
jgi:glycosyltransferase involved in cell wall biosynthesis